MISRKWLALAASVSLVALLSASLSSASMLQEEEEETLAKLMEQVTAANNKINRTVRTPVAFKKSQEEIIAHAKELVELGKKARERQEAIETAEDLENPKEQWEALMDDFITKTEEFAKVAEGSDQAAAKNSHTEVKKACAECHKVFRIEDDF